MEKKHYLLVNSNFWEDVLQDNTIPYTNKFIQECLNAWKDKLDDLYEMTEEFGPEYQYTIGDLINFFDSIKVVRSDF